TLDDTSTDWFHEMNLDPRYRAFAGIGAEVVKKHQEDFMELCWYQVDAVEEANRKLRALQLAEQASYSLYDRTFQAQSDDALVNLTNTIHARVMDVDLTVYGSVSESVIPTAANSAAFRRMTRPTGFLSINFDNGQPLNTVSLVSD